MPYCTSCGNPVAATDRFCARCGAAQPGAGSAETLSGAGQTSALRSLSPRTASTLCYIPLVGWIAALLVLAAERFRQERTVRFHAFQGLYLFVLWLLVDLVGANFAFEVPGFRWLIDPLKLAVVGAWIYLLIQTQQDRLVKLPFLGELADRSVEEQRQRAN